MRCERCVRLCLGLRGPVEAHFGVNKARIRRSSSAGYLLLLPTRNRLQLKLQQPQHSPARLQSLLKVATLQALVLEVECLAPAPQPFPSLLQPLYVVRLADAEVAPALLPPHVTLQTEPYRIAHPIVDPAQFLTLSIDCLSGRAHFCERRLSFFLLRPRNEISSTPPTNELNGAVHLGQLSLRFSKLLTGLPQLLLPRQQART
jgi:hypothetical protein